jgi:hypothetical protein
MDATTSALETPPMSPFDIVVLRAWEFRESAITVSCEEYLVTFMLQQVKTKWREWKGYRIYIREVFWIFGELRQEGGVTSSIQHIIQQICSQHDT